MTNDFCKVDVRPIPFDPDKLLIRYPDGRIQLVTVKVFIGKVADAIKRDS